MNDAPAAPGNASKGKEGEYVVVARRYRPQTFGELIGQQHVAQALCNAIETNRVGHAYLFTGARGVGKTSAARILAKALNCTDGPTANPCGECDVCESVASGGDVDVLEIDGASNRGIDEIRQLRSNIGVRPSRARFKVYIIDEVHMLTKEAFNALLKTLEEPPDHVKFIFCTTDPEKIPITVLSRCQRFDFAPVETNAIVARLQQIVASEGATAEPEALMMLARRAAGSMRDSQSLLEQLLSYAGDSITADYVHKMFGTAQGGRIASLVDRLQSRDTAAALAEIDAAVHEGVDIGQLAEQLVGHIRDIMAAGVGCDGEILLYNAPADLEKLRQQGVAWGLPTMLAALQILDQVVARMRQSIHRRLLLEVGVVRIANLGDLQQLSDLISQAANGETNAHAGAPKPATTDLDQKKNEAARPPAPASSAHISPTSEPSKVPSQSQSHAPAATTGSVGSNGQTGLSTASNGTPIASSISNPNRDAPEKLALDDADHEPAAPPAATLIDFETVDPMRLWKEATQATEGFVSEIAGDVHSVIRTTNKLNVTFPSSVGSSFCQRPERQAELERAVSALVGRSIRLEFNHEVREASPNRDRSTKTSMRDLVRKSHELPMVMKAIELFDAEVTRVQPSKKDSNDQAP